MKIVTAPEKIERVGYDCVFMAGGISGTPDWQSEYLSLAQKSPHLHEVQFFNPRRPNFDVKDPAMSDAQIKWEQYAMSISDLITFWFSPETTCPITLFELGCQLSRGDAEIIVGIHPDYVRKMDLKLQIPYYENYKTPIVYSVEDLVKKVEDWVKENMEMYEELMDLYGDDLE
jgi:hypothetical protein